jgi:hypothetical protein
MFGDNMRRYNCKGLRLLKLGKFQLELWLCPPWSFIPPHIHTGFDSYIIHIWGRIEAMKEYRNKVLPLFTFFSRFKIAANQTHGFNGRNSWFIFLNLEHWKTIPSTTADIDLIEV